MSLLDKIKAQKAAEAAAGIRTESEKIGLKDVNIKGSSLISKKLAAKSEAEYRRQEKGALKAGESDLVKQAEKQFTEGVEATIAEMRAAQAGKDIVYDESQLRAIAGIIHNKCSVLIGAAGTGKTTVTKEIVNQLAKRVKVVNVGDTLFVTAMKGDQEVRVLLREAVANGYEIKTNIAQVNKNDELPGIAFAAYTGRATQQIKRALPKIWHKNTSTIHKLLEYAPVFEEVDYIDNFGQQGVKTVRRFRPSFDASCKLPYTIYVFDEASMIPIPLFNEVIDAIHDTSRILLIGDIHQLPPVYGKSVLGYAMRKWPVFELTTIHRQAAGNAIIKNAHNTLKGRSLENAANFHIIGNGIGGTSASPGGSAELHTYFLAAIRKLADLKRYDPYTDAIIVPQNKGMVGTDALNEKLVLMFNPEIKENGVIINKRINIHTGNNHVYFAVRDKVMITSNINTVDPPITNGMIGIVESINVNGRYDMKRSQVDFGSLDDDDDDELNLDFGNLDASLSKTLGIEDEKKEKKDDDADDQRQSSHVLTIKFENGQTYTCSTAGDYRKVVHGYAATCHKSQGGEYPNIIILCHSVNAVMLTQEWLYTAITRARNNVYIICNSRGLDQALKRQVIKGNTLQEKIRSYIIETKADDEMNFDRNKYPILWEPKEV